MNQEPFKLVDFLKNYFTCVGGCALICGLIFNSPSWEPVKVVPLNPLAIVNAQELKIGLAARQPASIDFQRIQQHLSIDISDGIPRKLVFPVQLYDHPVGENVSPVKRNIQREFGQELIWNSYLKEAKRAFALNDSDQKLETWGKIFSSGEKMSTLEEMRKDPSKMGHEIFIMQPTGDMNYSLNMWASNPFYPLFEGAKSKLDKMHLYKALQDSTTFFSLFAIVNEGQLQANDLVVRINPSGRSQVKILQIGLDAQKIGKESGASGASDLTIESLRPGPKEFKLIGMVSNDEPVHREAVYLIKKGPVRQVAEYWQVIVGLPFFILLFIELRRILAL